jgi:hypothetical protein
LALNTKKQQEYSVQPPLQTKTPYRKQTNKKKLTSSTAPRLVIFLLLFFCVRFGTRPPRRSIKHVFLCSSHAFLAKPPTATTPKRISSTHTHAYMNKWNSCGVGTVETTVTLETSGDSICVCAFFFFSLPPSSSNRCYTCCHEHPSKP